MKRISFTTARRNVLHAQALAAPAGEDAGGMVARLGYVQIDTMAVVERAHHPVLWTRLPAYQPAAKRTYGYFGLPVLWGDRFVGRLAAFNGCDRLEVDAVVPATVKRPLVRAIRAQA